MSKKNKRRNRSKPHTRSQRPRSATPSLKDALIEQANTSYSHQSASTFAVIILNAVSCFLTGLLIAVILNLYIDSKDDVTWQTASFMAGLTVSLQVVLAVINAIVVVPCVTRVSRHMMQRRSGVIIPDDVVEKAIDENDQPSRVGPAAIAAAGCFFVCLQYDAPTKVLLWLPVAFATASPVVAHLTDHRTIRILWKGIKGIYDRATTRLSK